jgi:hypothetical protein
LGVAAACSNTPLSWLKESTLACLSLHAEVVGLTPIRHIFIFTFSKDYWSNRVTPSRLKSNHQSNRNVWQTHWSKICFWPVSLVNSWAGPPAWPAGNVWPEVFVHLFDFFFQCWQFFHWGSVGRFMMIGAPGEDFFGIVGNLWTKDTFWVLWLSSRITSGPFSDFPFWSLIGFLVFQKRLKGKKTQQIAALPSGISLCGKENLFEVLKERIGGVSDESTHQ